MNSASDFSGGRETPHTGPTQEGLPDASGNQAPQPRVVTDPQLDRHQKKGVSGSAWIALILGALVLILLLIFIVQNSAPTVFAYFGWTFTLPLGVATLFAAIAGMLVMALFGSVWLLRKGHRVRKLEKERDVIKRTMS